MRLCAAFGKLDMTPPLDMEGSYRLAPDGRAQGVHDPVYARWALFEQDGIRWCLVALDVVLLRNEQAERWRRRIGEVAETSAERVTVSCTHTHNGPDLPNEWGRIDRNWEVALVDRIASDIAAARERIVPVRCAWGAARYDAAINRHANRIASRLADGDEQFVAALTPEARRRYENEPGPVDPMLTILRVDREDGSPLGHLVRFSAHATTAMGAGRLLSADYPGYLLRETESAVGGVGLFLQGTCGDVNLEVGPRGYEHAMRHGVRMGRLVADVLKGIVPATIEEPLAVAAATFRAEVRTDMRSESDIREEMDRLVEPQRAYEREHPGTVTPRVIWNPIRALRMEMCALEYLRDKTYLPVSAQHVRLAGRSLLITPGEWFVEFGLRLEDALPDLRPLWVGYSNGNIGYVPTTDGWGEPGYMTACRFYPINGLARGEGERLFQQFVEWMRNGAEVPASDG